MVSTRETKDVSKKSRQKLAAENMTRTQRIMHALQSGALKSELRTVQEAIHAARGLSMQLESQGLKYGENCAVHIAYFTPDLSMLFTRMFVKGEEAKIQADLSQTCCIMAGLVFGLQDPDHDDDWYVGARAFLNTPLVITALKHRVESQDIGLN